MLPFDHDENLVIDQPFSVQYKYWFGAAERLYRTRNEPFDNDEDLEWYNNRLEYCIKKYMEVQEKQDEDQKLSLTEKMWLTFCPRRDITLRKAQEAVEKFCHKSKIDKYIYVVEQRATSEASMDDHNSFHFHIVHTHKYDRSTHYKRETKSSFRKLCAVDKWSCLCMMPNKTDQDVTQRLGYILGEKEDNEGLLKKAKQDIDKVFRKKYMLKDYYTNDKSFWVNFYDF